VKEESEWSKDKMLQQLNYLEEERRLELYHTLEKYKTYLTSKPGKCNLFTYNFQVETDKPIVGYSRPIPFALRTEVRGKLNR
jgi:hypothetical protein